ncbi:hypothetical protein L0337_43375 [candidate division KSB1 bacterium]|nr:hypothetical protein [candidate division KSB1 bacterium]
MNEEDKLLKILEIETNRVNHLDTILFNIKVWTTTLGIVMIGFVFENKFKEGTTFLLLAIGATIIFFLIDIYFRKIQLRHNKNTTEIRRYLKSIGDVEVWDKLWAKEIPVRGKFRQSLIDHGYTIGVYGFLLLTLIIIWLVNS